MKKLYFSLSVIALFLPVLSQAQTCQLKSDTIYNTNGTNHVTEIDVYNYKFGVQLARIDHYFGNTGGPVFLNDYDSVYYSSGNIDSVVNFGGYTNQRTGTILKNTWTGSLLTKQTSYNPTSYGDGVHADTSFYSYSGSDISASTTYQWVNGSLNNTDVITSISVSGGNVSHANYDGDDVTLTTDSAPNPFYHWAIQNDFLSYFSANNVVQVSLDADPSILLLQNTLVYSSNSQLYSVDPVTDGSYEKHTVYNIDCSTVTAVVAQSNAKEVFVYPNPSQDGLFNLNTDQMQFNKVSVRNATGQVVKEYAANTASITTIDLSAAPHGIYTLQLSGNDAVWVSKLVKQ